MSGINFQIDFSRRSDPDGDEFGSSGAANLPYQW